MFEGLKAYRKHDGNILLFRPEENATRLMMGAERMCMPSPSVEQFVEAVKATVLANERWVICSFNFHKSQENYVIERLVPTKFIFFAYFRFLLQVKVHYT